MVHDPPRPISDVATELGVEDEHVLPYGRDAAKIDLGLLGRAPTGKGRLVLVSAITPTPAGEGKTTVSVALAMALRRIGQKTTVCLREPSLGPVFGVKGGGTGGGRSQVVPSDHINLHFTGDMHAVSSAHNLLAALVDNDLHFGSKSGVDIRRVMWPRVLDMNDRALRDVVVGLGGRPGGVPRETRFDITAASEVMAILCLSSSLSDLRQRLARTVVGLRSDMSPVTVADLEATDAMAALLKDALMPNLVQTTEGGPALVHGGPFANIAHGCSSVVATRVAQHLSDVVVTEAGFGFDLGGEKLLHIKCRAAGIWPRCVVLVATLRALVSHGGGEDGSEDGQLPNVERGLAHLDRQIANVRAFGLEPIVALNVFDGDSEDALQAVQRHCARHGVRSGRSTAFVDGGAGAESLAQIVLEVLEETDEDPPTPRYLYDLEDSYEDKLRAVACGLYGATDVQFDPSAARQIRRIMKAGYGRFPICIAKTHLSLSDDPRAGGNPGVFRVHVRSVRLSAGAGFLVALLGDSLTMPGLPREPAARRVRIDEDGRVHGLMQNE